jgi:Na+/proline symporter
MVANRLIWEYSSQMFHASSYLVLVAVVVPLAIYVWGALRVPRTVVSTPADYFIAYRRIGTSPFADSSLAYAFQVATLYPFLYWGITGQVLPAIVNAVCWGLGILLFRAFLTPILARLGGGAGPRTLHGLLGDAFHSRAVQRIAAGATIIGMLGVALAESYWGMQVFRVLVPEDTQPFFAMMMGALLFVLLYIWYGGTWGSMKTDMLQLVFAYIGFTCVFLYALWVFFRTGAAYRAESMVVSALMLVGAAAAVLVRLRFKVMPISGVSPLAEEDPTEAVWRRLARVMSLLTFCALVVLALSFGFLMMRSLPSMSLAPLLKPGDPGWLGVAALMFLGLFFQFVDMSAWQRIQAIGGTPTERRSSALHGLLVYAVESPFSWILCLALGTVLITVVPELATAQDKAGPLAAFPRLLLASGALGRVAVATLFMIAVMAVMFSTIDSALLAVMYAFVGDIKGCRFETAEELTDEVKVRNARRELLLGKKAAFWLVLAICGGVVLLGALLKTPDRLIGILVGFYSAMLALLPAVVMMLRGARRWSGTAVATGMSVGVVVAVGFTLWGLREPSKSWWAVFAAPAFAAVVPLLWPRGHRRA